jgi:hypothetical protein
MNVIARMGTKCEQKNYAIYIEGIMSNDKTGDADDASLLWSRCHGIRGKVRTQEELVTRISKILEKIDKKQQLKSRYIYFSRVQQRKRNFIQGKVKTLQTYAKTRSR